MENVMLISSTAGTSDSILLSSAPITFEAEVQNLPTDVRTLLENRDGGWKLCELLPTLYTSSQVSQGGNSARPWEVCGLLLQKSGRLHEALAIFERLYLHMLEHETQSKIHVMKGMPLVWMSDCHVGLGRPVVAKRFIMLTLIEDAIASKGAVSPEHHGSYFRAVWMHGLSHNLVMKYAKESYDLFQKDSAKGAYPEWILQNLDQEWLSGYPSREEVDLYPVNRKYLSFLMAGLGDGTGKHLELLAEYMMSVMPGCRVYRRKRSHSTDYDIVCAMEGLQTDFRAEFGRYFVCECKDWDKDPAGFSEFAKFCRVLDSVKSKFGILFSKNGISGASSGDDATREQMKVFQDRGIIIIVVSESDLREIANPDGRNFISLLRSRYESVRLDLEA
jgi:hypothetical protein